MQYIISLIILLISYNVLAGDDDKVKKGIIEKFTSGLSSSIENILAGEGDTKVQIDFGEDYKPEFSIARPLSTNLEETTETTPAALYTTTPVLLEEFI